MLNSKILAELDFIFSQLPHSYKIKVPQNMIDEAHSKKDIQRFNELDISKPFTEQNISKEALQVFNKIIVKYLIA